MDFEFLICYIKHLINRRPIAFKEELRTSKLCSVPEPITPEHLIKGYEPASLNIIPELLPLPDDIDWSPQDSPSGVIRGSYTKLQRVQAKVKEIYSNEFLRTLIAQAVDKKDRFQPVNHDGVQVGDIILLKEVNTKPNHYPLAIVKNVCTNNMGEVTGVIALKGKTRELVKRHSSTIIPMLRTYDDHETNQMIDNQQPEMEKAQRPVRKAAEISREKSKEMLK